MIFRSNKAKTDPVLSWQRPDWPFFSSGACHVLAAAFLELHPREGYHTLVIRPEPGFRGGHIVVSNGKMVFDYHGYSLESVFLRHYTAKIRRLMPGWRGAILRSDDVPVSAEFCAQNKLRKPDQFLHDPFPRALAYVRRMEARPTHRGASEAPQT